MNKNHSRNLLRVLLASCLIALISTFSILAQEKKNPQKPNTARFSFKKAKEGKIPSSFLITETNGKKKPAVWQVLTDPTAPVKPKVFALTESKNAGNTFNLAILKTKKFTDLKMSVHLKATSGSEDQGGGPIWRVKDAKNYYVTRWNPLENNLRLYTVKDAKRRELASVDIKTDNKAWHEIEVEHVGKQIEIKFDGKEALKFEDSTFSEAGRIGLWTKADAATRFDNFTAEEILKTGNGIDKKKK